MSRLDGLRHRLGALFRSTRYERELRDELDFHLSLDASQRAATGAASGDAHRAARLRLGNPTVINEERRMTAIGFVDVLWQDLRYGWRALRHAPLFTLVAAGSLALGIGANTAVFSLLYGVLLQRLPLPNAEQLVQPARVGTRGINDLFQWPEYALLRDSTPLASIAGYTTFGVGVTIDGAQRYEGVHLVTGSYFPLLGARPELGRFLSTADEQPPSDAAVIAWSLWQTSYNGAPDVIGRTILINGAPFTIVGVAGRNFRSVQFPDAFRLAMPLASSTLAGLPAHTSPSAHPLNVIARLDARRGLAQTTAALDVRFQHLRQSLGALPAASKKGVGSSVEHLTLIDASRGVSGRKFDVRSQYRRLLVILMGGVGVLLLVACANVASLLLARALARRRELAVRLSVGASRARLVRQLLTESVLLALIGGAAALVLAWRGNAVLARELPTDTAALLGDLVRFRPNAAILGFTAAVSLLTGVLFGVLPALRASRIDLAPMLKESARTIGGASGASGRLGSLLIVAQIALSCLLLVSAGLFVRTLRNLRQVDLGFDRSHVLIAQIDPRGTPLQDAPLAPLALDILERVRQIPGVESATLGARTPVLGGSRMWTPIRVAGYEPVPGEKLEVEFDGVAPDFLRTLAIPLIAGREFTRGDVAGAPAVAIVSSRFATRFFPGGNPVGQPIWMPNNAADGTPPGPPLTIVGVAGDVRFDGPRSEAPLLIYRPLAQEPVLRIVALSLRTAGAPTTLAPAVRREIERVAPGIRITRLSSLEEQLDAMLVQERFAAALGSAFGSIALLLACLGLYGLMAYQVVRRTTEIGVRMALGARRGNVLWLVLRETLALVGVGVAVGFVLAFAGTRVLANQLYGVLASDAVTMLGATVLLVGVASLAGYLPARRASRIDPLVAMRE